MVSHKHHFHFISDSIRTQKTTMPLRDHMMILPDVKALYTIGGRPLDDWRELDWPCDGTRTRGDINLLNILSNKGERT